MNLDFLNSIRKEGLDLVTENKENMFNHQNRKNVISNDS